ncbi:signal peptidase II [Jiangella anatolica]|uniref:Lipoprotein signal peptidase n=1 Tax=Jiangella anatolica TaxID=2670374 RepID=A0A2W2BX74_9ACTN|nr:signal peptidase II [Jiangella anatolica]PZF80227.1 signal peptidase II [Jiangella anatolica]
MPTTPDPDSGDATAGESESEPAPTNWRLIGRLAAITVVVTGIDQLTKWWAESELAGREPIELVGDLLQLRLLYNSGAAFSLATGMTWLLTLIVVIVIAAVIRASAKLGSTAWAVALGLLLGGAFGNLIDRLFRDPGFPEGHVVDFIDYGGLFVGNVADIAITAAAVLIALLTWRGVSIDGVRRGAAPTTEA